MYLNRAKTEMDEHIAVLDNWDEFCSSLDKKMVSCCTVLMHGKSKNIYMYTVVASHYMYVGILLILILSLNLFKNNYDYF